MTAIDLRFEYGQFANSPTKYNLFLFPALALNYHSGISELWQITIDPIEDRPNFIYANLNDAITDFKVSRAPDLVAQLSALHGVTYTVGNIESYFDRTVDGTFALASQVPTFTQSSETRSLNTAFQISSTKGAFVNYSVRIANVLTLTGGAAGDVILEIATNSGFTTGVQEIGRTGNSNTGGLVVGLTLNDAVAGTVSGFVPAGYYARLRTVNTTGTPTYTYLSGQKTLV